MKLERNEVVYISHCDYLKLTIIVFLLQGPVAVKVQVPNMQDKTEWKLNGQVLNFTVPLTDQVSKCCLIVSIFLWSVHLLHSYNYANVISLQVSVIKVKIHEATGMPAGKQKLQYEVNFSFNLVATCDVLSALIWGLNKTSELFCSFIGYFYQGLQLPGLLQHEQWFNHSLGTEGERWKKEVNHAARRKKKHTCWCFVTHLSCNFSLIIIFRIMLHFSYICVKGVLFLNVNSH